MTENSMTENAVIEAVSAMDLTEKQRKAVVCAIVGHSRIVTTCLGEVYCGRCEAKIGDTIMGMFDLRNVVISGHKCPICETNYKSLTWQDLLYAPDPFAEEASETDE